MIFCKIKTHVFYLACHSFRTHKEQSGVLGCGQAFAVNSKTLKTCTPVKCNYS